MSSRIELIYFNAGGGHRAAMQALSSAIRQQERGWKITTTNLFDVIDTGKLFKKVTKTDPEDLYNKVLASGFTVGLGPQLKVLQTVIRANREQLVRRLQTHWKESQPDLVVSLIPNFNRAIGDSLDTAFVTVITDMADLPPRFWIEPKTMQPQHIVAGTEFAAAQAIVAGIPPSRVHRVSGMMLRPEFYLPQQPTTQRPTTGLVMFGGIGSKDMIPIAERLASHHLILVCGKNEKLTQKLKKINNPKHEVHGFVTDMPSLMNRADYFIGKPGPASISEAVHMKLPVIVSLNSFTMPQEKWNCQWVLDQNVGLIVNNFKHIDAAVMVLMDRFDELRQSVYAVNNRAVFEVPDILQKFL